MRSVEHKLIENKRILIAKRIIDSFGNFVEEEEEECGSTPLNMIKYYRKSPGEFKIVFNKEKVDKILMLKELLV